MSSFLDWQVSLSLMAVQEGLSVTTVEEEAWIYWMLDYLFSLSKDAIISISGEDPARGFLQAVSAKQNDPNVTIARLARTLWRR
ncbi:MAG: hypothetical protein FWE76_07020 [Symbiobacteriaceae bacterium]|nr:hypothetical protein [Symbiobacteriaceae bacterium]